MKNKSEVPSRHEIWKMFDQISPTYDCVNRIMTLGCDQLWRKKVSDFLPPSHNLHILDCATGTGDQIIALLEKNPHISSVIGIDLAETMINIGKQKIEKKPYKHKVTFQVANVLDTPFLDEQFDCVTIAFGIRNVTDVMAAFKEFRRILKPNGRVLILEGTIPYLKGLRMIHRFYLRKCLPLIGGIFSKNRDAYRYLNKTIETFPQGERFCSLMRAAGFVQVKANPIFGGIVTVYQGNKNGFH